MANKDLLYFGDNLPVFREHINDDTVDLIYLDPPFNSKATYNVLFKERSGSRSAAQIRAFTDTWRWDEAAVMSYEGVVNEGGRVAEAMRAFQVLMPKSNALAYLSMMAPRLKELHQVLKSTGSLYLHCDPNASHFIKVLLDAVFGPKGFRNEIVWKRTPFAGSSKARAMQYPKSHDIILFYTKGPKWTWNGPTLPYSAKYLKRFIHDDSDGRGPYRKTLLKTYSEETFARLKEENSLVQPESEGAMYSYKQFLRKSSGTTQIDDLWTDINALNPVARERLGYPTQKPEALLERIIEASSNQGDLVLDPFCGCGTATAVSQRLGRRWIGIDITYLAIKLIKRRLRDTFGKKVDSSYQIIGSPTTIEDAEALAKMDRYQFQWWALDMVDARTTADQKKKSADRGIDGKLYFHDDAASGTTKLVVLSVKSGGVGVKDVRELNDVVRRENAALGVLITLEPPSQPMRAEAAQAGTYKSPWRNRPFHKTQILTVADLFDGKEIDMPPRAETNVTFKKAPRAKGKLAVQSELFDCEEE